MNEQRECVADSSTVSPKHSSSQCICTNACGTYPWLLWIDCLSIHFYLLNSYHTMHTSTIWCHWCDPTTVFPCFFCQFSFDFQQFSLTHDEYLRVFVVGCQLFLFVVFAFIFIIVVVLLLHSTVCAVCYASAVWGEFGWFHLRLKLVEMQHWRWISSLSFDLLRNLKFPNRNSLQSCYSSFMGGDGRSKVHDADLRRTQWQWIQWSSFSL